MSNALFNGLLILYYIGTCFLYVFIYVMMMTSYLIGVAHIHTFDDVLHIAMDILGAFENALF